MKKTEKSNTNEIIEIPAEEAPYALPDGWKWVRLEQISEIIMGQSPSGDSTTDDPSFLPLIGGAADMGTVYPKISRYTKIPTKISKKDDLILCVRATLGRPIFSDGEYCLGRGVAAVRSNLLVKEYLRYFFISFEQYFYDNATGSTFAQISSEILKKMPIPLPPLETQKCIVDRIESLFAKLDEAKEKAQTALDTFELRKSAILHKAFTGELTAKWRSLNSTSNISNESVLLESTLADISSSTTTGHSENVLGDLPFPWEIKPLSSVCKSIFDGDHQPPPKSENGVPFIFISNVNKGILLFDECSYVSQEYYDNLKDTRKPEYGDVLYTLVGSYGIPVVVDKTQAFCFQRHMALLKPKNIDTYFLWYQLQTSRVFNEATKIATGTAQLTVPIKGLRELQIIVPPLPEQQEIVRILDDLLAKENAAKEAAEAVIEKIDLMKKSILARAFRGEL